MKCGSAPKGAPQTAGQDDLDRRYRADDFAEQLLEAERWIDAADIALMAALDGRLDRDEATEHAIACHGRARRAVQLAVAA